MNFVPYDEVKQRIYGTEVSQDGHRLIKDLGILSQNLEKVVALEDKTEIVDEEGNLFIGFAPRDRVIEVDRHENFMMKYRQAFKMLR